MRHRILLPLLAVLVAAGCDSRDTRHFGRHLLGDGSDKFGMATRKETPAENGETEVVASVESTDTASWMEARAAMKRDEVDVCEHSRYAGATSHSPANVQRGDYFAPHPAGTVFTLTLRCPAPWPGEFAVPATTSLDESRRLVLSRLDEAPAREGSMRFVARMFYASIWQKNDVVAEHVGTMMMMRLRECGGQVALDRLVIAVHPSKDLGARMRGGDLQIGTDIRCIGAGAVTAAPVDSTPD